MHAAVAAGQETGGHATIVEAAGAMVAPARETYRPIAENHAVYDELYREYVRLHDLFGRGGNDVMKTLRRLQATQPIVSPAP